MDALTQDYVCSRNDPQNDGVKIGIIIWNKVICSFENNVRNISIAEIKFIGQYNYNGLQQKSFLFSYCPFIQWFRLIQVYDLTDFSSVKFILASIIMNNFSLWLCLPYFQLYFFFMIQDSSQLILPILLYHLFFSIQDISTNLHQYLSQLVKNQLSKLWKFQQVLDRTHQQKIIYYFFQRLISKIS